LLKLNLQVLVTVSQETLHDASVAFVVAFECETVEFIHSVQFTGSTSVMFCIVYSDDAKFFTVIV